MRKITQKEFDEIAISRKKTSEFTNEILKLEIGEGIFVSNEEWKIKSRVSVYLSNYSLKYGKKFSTKTVKNEGFYVIRIK